MPRLKAAVQARKETALESLRDASGRRVAFIRRGALAPGGAVREGLQPTGGGLRRRLLRRSDSLF